MRLNPATARCGSCLLGVSLLTLLAVTLPPEWQNLMQFQHRTIAGGELWRLLSGHLLHLGWKHLLMNLLGLWLIWALLLRSESNGSCILVLCLVALGTSLGLYLLSPQIAWYRGLSGVLHGLLVWALLKQWRSSPLTHGIILGLLALKLAWEQTAGPLPGSAELVSGRIVVEAHLYGALSGALLWAVQLGTDKITREITE
ncbi:MAG: rhombosortase [Chromatiales bacterium]|jgi:rhomboid family GlyGly-CTERM serine protease